MGTAKMTTLVLGRWSIDCMSMWDKDYIDAEVPGYFDFGGNNLGSFRFGYVRGDLDYRFTQRDGKPTVEFSFEGCDWANGSPCSGRGWMTLADDRLVGMFFFHCGDESEIELSRLPGPAKKPRKRR